MLCYHICPESKIGYQHTIGPNETCAYLNFRRCGHCLACTGDQPSLFETRKLHKLEKEFKPIMLDAKQKASGERED